MNARKDLPKLKSGNLTSKFDELIKVIPQPYEKLTGLPHYSRRLNIKHRLVYSVDEESKTITILSGWSHYKCVV
ncbi:Txe/YoeB family addiction module toxin [Enterococcus sp. OL5]|nr:type II toxin-antitoxin system YoeB family toxin [Enterococcus sp. OL5]TPR56934.1 Txe/YoeB family addiction module toxin [Enterococcus sp. OL5]